MSKNLYLYTQSDRFWLAFLLYYKLRTIENRNYHHYLCWLLTDLGLVVGLTFQHFGDNWCIGLEVNGNARVTLSHTLI